MNRTKKAGLSVKSGLSLMCIVCLLCGLLCGFFWLAGENSALAAGPDGSALAEETLKLDFDVRRGETFTLTAKDAAGNETARGAFTYDGGVMTVVLSWDGFALKDKAE